MSAASKARATSFGGSAPVATRRKPCATPCRPHRGDAPPLRRKRSRSAASVGTRARRRSASGEITAGASVTAAGARERKTAHGRCAAPPVRRHPPAPSGASAARPVSERWVATHSRRNAVSSALDGSAPATRRKDTSSKVACSASSFTSYPRYVRRPRSASRWHTAETSCPVSGAGSAGEVIRMNLNDRGNGQQPGKWHVPRLPESCGPTLRPVSPLRRAIPGCVREAVGVDPA